MENEDYKSRLEESAKTHRHRLPAYPEFDEVTFKNLTGRCLEVGCGDGLGTRSLRQRCSSLVSIDLSRERLKIAEENTSGLDVEFVLADARKLPFPDESFDTVCAFEVIEHFPEYSDQEKFLKEAARVLKKDGVLLVSTPNRPLFRLYCLLTKEKDETHFTEVNYFEFKKVLKKVFPAVEIHGKFGWLSPGYRFRFVRTTHDLLSRFPLICKGLLAVCRRSDKR